MARAARTAGSATSAAPLDVPKDTQYSDASVEDLIERGRALVFLPGPLRDAGSALGTDCTATR